MANADFLTGALEETDSLAPLPTNPVQLTRVDNYFVQPSFPGATVTINLDSFDTTNYDPYLEIYQLAPGQDSPVPGQSPLVVNDDFGGSLNSQVSFVNSGSSQYLVRVTSFTVLPDPNIPSIRTLPAPYSLTAQVDLGDIAIEGGSSGVARYWDSVAGSHFFTSDPTEIDNTNANPQYNNEGFEFLSEGDVTLQRYVNSQGGYFYANPSNPGEVEFIQTLQEWSPDPSAVGIQVYSSQQPGTQPVFRAYNLDTNGHFYTIDPAQAFFADSLPNFRLEPGVAFYAQPI